MSIKKPILVVAVCSNREADCSGCPIHYKHLDCAPLLCIPPTTKDGEKIMGIWNRTKKRMIFVPVSGIQVLHKEIKGGKAIALIDSRTHETVVSVHGLSFNAPCFDKKGLACVFLPNCLYEKDKKGRCGEYISQYAMIVPENVKATIKSRIDKYRGKETDSYIR